MLQTFPLGIRSAMLQIFRGKVCNVADLPGGRHAMLQTLSQGGRFAIQHREDLPAAGRHSNLYKLRPSFHRHLSYKAEFIVFALNGKETVSISVQSHLQAHR